MRKRKEKSKVVYSIEVGSSHENISSCLKSENLSGLLLQMLRIDCALVLALAQALSRGTGEAIAALTGDLLPRGVAVRARGSRLGGGRLGGENRSNGVHSVQVVVENMFLGAHTSKFPQRTHLKRQRPCRCRRSHSTQRLPLMMKSGEAVNCGKIRKKRDWKFTASPKQGPTHDLSTGVIRDC